MEGSECVDNLIKWVTSGTLLEKLREDPLCVFKCVLTVVQLIVEKIDGDHDHSPDSDDDAVPLVIGDGAFESKCCDLYQALGGVVPSASVGIGNGLILRMLLPILLNRAQEWFKDWLDDQDA